MKRTFKTLLLAASAFTMLGVSSLKAQERGIANVPFAFQVQSQTMPAGKYEVKQFAGGDMALLSLSDWNGHNRFVMAPLLNHANPQEPKLTFARTNGVYTLVKVDLPGSSVSRGLVPESTYKVGMAALVKVSIAH